MRKFTVTIYANDEYTVRERLQEIDNSISNIVWPCSYPYSESTKTKKATGYIEEEKEFHLSDYEYKKEDPTWSSCNPMVTTGRWKMEVVSDQDYVNFQKSEEL